MKNFNVVHGDDPEGLIRGTKEAVISAIKTVVLDFEKDIGGSGLTWDQIKFIIDEFEKKEPVIIYQEHEL